MRSFSPRVVSDTITRLHHSLHNVYRALRCSLLSDSRMLHNLSSTIITFSKFIEHFKLSLGLTTCRKGGDYSLFVRVTEDVFFSPASVLPPDYSRAPLICGSSAEKASSLSLSFKIDWLTLLSENRLIFNYYVVEENF